MSSHGTTWALVIWTILCSLVALAWPWGGAVLVAVVICCLGLLALWLVTRPLGSNSAPIGPPKRSEADSTPQWQGWTHDAAYHALRNRYRGRPTQAGAYAFLYRQRPNSAVLYESHAPAARVRRRPLHLHPNSRSANVALFRELEPYIRVEYTETSAKKSTAPVQWCAVTDWNGFARVVGLPSSPQA